MIKTYVFSKETSQNESIRHKKLFYYNKYMQLMFLDGGQNYLAKEIPGRDSLYLNTKKILSILKLKCYYIIIGQNFHSDSSLLKIHMDTFSPTGIQYFSI
jgi:hypothetical protein